MIMPTPLSAPQVTVSIARNTPAAMKVHKGQVQGGVTPINFSVTTDSKSRQSVSGYIVRDLVQSGSPYVASFNTICLYKDYGNGHSVAVAGPVSVDMTKPFDGTITFRLYSPEVLEANSTTQYHVNLGVTDQGSPESVHTFAVSPTILDSGATIPAVTVKPTDDKFAGTGTVVVGEAIGNPITIVNDPIPNSKR